MRWLKGVRGAIGAGSLLILCGFGWDLFFAGIPYQDPTPQMQASWQMHNTSAEWTMAAGPLLILAGMGIAAFLRVRRRLKREG